MDGLIREGPSSLAWASGEIGHGAIALSRVLFNKSYSLAVVFS